MKINKKKEISPNDQWTADEFNGMPYRCLGNSGLRVANLGIGTWKFGYPEKGDGARVDEKTAHLIFDRAIEIGATFWDTANRYNDATGNSERVIGTWLALNPSQRRNVILATKIYAPMDGVSPNHSRLSRLNIIESVQACQERLQVDYIDLLYFHLFDATTPVEESLSAIEDLVRQGVIRYFAVSNFTVDQLTQYQSCESRFSNRVRLLAVQNQFDIISLENAEKPGVIDYCAQNGMSFIAWTPLLKGLLTDKYQDIAAVGKGDRLYDEGTLDAAREMHDFPRIQKLARLSKKWDITLNQLVIAYMLTIPGMGPVIASVSSVSQLESNAKGGRITFSREEIREIEEVLTEK
jgi:aryl-alcohol dehydrogenase-like predicted oxidoreductase